MSNPILKSFTFVPQPKVSNDPAVIKRERIVARLEDQKKSHIKMVAARCQRRLCDDPEGRVEAGRVREGQGGHRRWDAGQAA